jgi:glucose/arabinose dehydrogenase/regulation of enolase protein 1 (concanavalin A-like superfamily)/mono/diheme cytochrome c family protein
MLALIAFIEVVHAQPHGLPTRPIVGPYLNGAMPAQPPVIGTDWTTVVAFPDLTFLNPMGILPMPGTTRLIVWEREGRIYHFENTPEVTNSQRTLIVDFSAVCQGWDDSGLLGIAFHPEFSLAGEVGTNRFLYVYYNHVRPNQPVQGSPTERPVPFHPTINRLSRLTLGENGVALPGSELVIIEQYDNSVWHNGGGMFFHPANGFLYLTNGDDLDTANSNRLDLSLFSGVLRIDVDKKGGNVSHPPPRRAVNETSPNWPQYFIPNDNPFVGVPNALEEFFAVGLRSPHRMTVDPPTGRIFIGDVGSNLREEVTAIEPWDAPGLNLQWGQIEGYNGDLTAPYFGSNKRPIIDYPHGDDGNAVIGGYIYRGTAFPELVGKYIFADNGSNRIWYLDESTHTETTPAGKVLLAIMPKGTGPNSGNDYTGISSFGLDASNELYICQLGSNGGKIFKLQRGSPQQGTPLPATLSATGVFSDTENLIPGGKLIPYTLNHPFWSDAAVKTRWASVPNSTTVGFASTGEWTWPEGSVLVKHFELPIDDANPALRKRLETRLIVKNATGVYGATYKWRADNKDADLIDTAFTENIPVKLAPLGPFTSTDIGSPTLSGSDTRANDLVTITAAGAGISGTMDQFRFAHQQRTGDFDLAVKVESLTNSNINTMAGIMARESLVADSRHVTALAFPNNDPRPNSSGGYQWKSRETSGGPTTTIYPGIPSPLVNYPNTWLRLQRIGNMFIGSSSMDGIRWKEFARQQVSLPATVYLGLAATSNDIQVPTSAVFRLESTRIQPWYYPSRSDCMICHSNNAGGVLGPKTRQLNGNLVYPNGVTDNQLRAWGHVGIFDNPPPEASLPNLDALVALDHPSASLEKRARSYLDSNCASCHRPGGSAAQSVWDARYDTPLALQGIVYGQLTDKPGDPTACVIVPQDLSRSMIYRRMSILGPNQMPPLAKSRVDTAGIGLMEEWINSLAANSPPLVTLTSPTDGVVFNQSDVITLSATASDSDGIRRVEFYDGNLKIAEVQSPPYSFVWTGARRGSHQIYALTFDNTGNTGASARSNIIIQSTPVIGWEHTDIGDVGVPGDASHNAGSGTYTVQGSGDDIWGGSDGFHFLYKEISGNTMLTARITSFESPEAWAKAGVMLRESTAPGSKYSFSLVNATYSAHQQSRNVTDGGSVINNGPWVGIPRWLRLVRTGNNFSAYHSPNGTAWTLMSTETIPMNTTVLAGLAVTSHNNSLLNQATFDNVSFVTQAPTVVLTSPQPDTTLNHPTSLNLSASVTLGTNPVSRVEFLVDGILIGQSTRQPYTFTWTSPLYGTHELTAQAVDSLGQVGVSPPIPITLNVNNTPGFRAEYYNNPDFTNLVMVRADPKIDFNWGEGSPDPRIDSDSYSVRWSGYLSPPGSGFYDLTVETDDGVRVWLNGQQVINQWINQGPTRRSANVPLSANGSNHIVMEYFENGGGAMARLFWKSATGNEEVIASNNVIVPPVNESPTVSLDTPLAGSSNLTIDTLTFSANATDRDGTIARVEFWADGAKLGERSTAPYEWSWPGPRTPGQHSLRAIAVDNNGAATSTLPIQIEILPFSLQAVGVQSTIEPPATTFTVRTTLPAGRDYIIEWSADLTLWTPLQSGTSTGAVIEAIQETTGIGQRFYRLHVPN